MIRPKPKVSKEDEGANVVYVAWHNTQMKYKGKHGYSITSDVTFHDVAIVGWAETTCKRSAIFMSSESQFPIRSAGNDKLIHTICI